MFSPITPPLYLDMGFVTSSAGSITDGSGLGLTVTGKIFMGMTDWALTDTNAVIQYNMAMSSLTYTLTSNSVTRTRTAYFWYREKACPTYYYEDASSCSSCNFTCTTCTGPTSSECLSC